MMMRPSSQQNTQNDISNSKKDLTTLAIEKNPCGLCRAFGLPICKGHGGGSGGGGDGGTQSSGHASNEERTVKFIPAADISDSAPGIFNKNDKAKPFLYKENELNVNDKTFNIDIINALLDKQILSIENDSERGILRIKCHPVFHASLFDDEKDELNKFFTIIREEFNHFKSEKSLSSANDCSIEQDNQNNILSLTIHITSPQLHNEFIGRLTSHFRDIPAVEKIKKSKNQTTNEEEKSTYSAPNPFKIGDGPST